MKYTASMIAWNPYSNHIKVGPWPDTNNWSFKYRMTCGACNLEVHSLTADQQLANLFIHFNNIVVRDGVDVQAAHDAFLNIDEYRQYIAPDMRGAEP